MGFVLRLLQWCLVFLKILRCILTCLYEASLLQVNFLPQITIPIPKETEVSSWIESNRTASISVVYNKYSGAKAEEEVKYNGRNMDFEIEVAPSLRLSVIWRMGLWWGLNKIMTPVKNKCSKIMHIHFLLHKVSAVDSWDDWWERWFSRRWDWGKELSFTGMKSAGEAGWDLLILCLGSSGVPSLLTTQALPPL